MYHVKEAFDIEWDVDNPEDLEELPTSVVIPEEVVEWAECDDDITEWLENEFGTFVIDYTLV